MNSNNRARRLEEAKVLGVALTMARIASWQFDRNASLLLPHQFANYLYTASAELLLVPIVGPFGTVRGQVTRATREARSDALIVGVGRSSSSEQVYVSAAIWKPEAT